MVAVPKPEKKKKRGKKKLPSIRFLINKADRVFSAYIRKRDMVELKGKCCTCGSPGREAGHFIKRQHKKVRWNVRNVHLQCVRCNHFLDGNESAYAGFIIERYGQTQLFELLDQRGTYKPTREELEKIIDTYKES